MKHTIQIEMHSRFGEFCASGENAVKLLKSEIYPILDKQPANLAFDFYGVRNINSSFSNALFANLVRRYGEQIVQSISIANVKPNLKSEILYSFSMATSEIDEAQKVCS